MLATQSNTLELPLIGSTEREFWVHQSAKVLHGIYYLINDKRPASVYILSML